MEKSVFFLMLDYSLSPSHPSPLIILVIRVTLILSPFLQKQIAKSICIVFSWTLYFSNKKYIFIFNPLFIKAWETCQMQFIHLYIFYNSFVSYTSRRGGGEEEEGGEGRRKRKSKAAWLGLVQIRVKQFWDKREVNRRKFSFFKNGILKMKWHLIFNKILILI